MISLSFYLLSNLLPLHLQHLLLFVGVVRDVLPSDQQLAFHGLAVSTTPHTHTHSMTHPGKFVETLRMIEVKIGHVMLPATDVLNVQHLLQCTSAPKGERQSDRQTA